MVRVGLTWLSLICGLAGWIALGAASAPQFNPGWAAWVNHLPPALTSLPGFLTGSAVVLLVQGRSSTPPTPPAMALLLFSVAGLLGLSATAAFAGYIKPINAVLVFVFGALTLCAGAFAFEALHEDDGVSIESHWGGLGGGLGGWNLSKSAVLILLLLTFAGATAATAVYDPQKAAANPAPKSPPSLHTTPRKAEANPVVGEQRVKVGDGAP